MPDSLRSLLGLCLLCAMLCANILEQTAIAAEPSLANIEKRIDGELKKAAERRVSLERLTTQERDANEALAATESRIHQIEATLETHGFQITTLAKDDSSAGVEYESILQEQAHTEKIQADTMALLWSVVCKRQSIGSREMADWAQADRDYAWSRELYTALEKYRIQLENQAVQLKNVLERREKLAVEMQKRLRFIEQEKKELLQTRLEYSQRLATLRRERSSTEADLEQVLSLISSLNFQLEQVGAKIENQKGHLPWPATGKMRQAYAPAATPAMRGIGIATQEKQEVYAVAGGKVVHNDVLRGFGTVLILQHGAEYYSLYAFLGSSPLKVGEEIVSRARVGTVGYYPALDGPGLYFELRFKQKAINPEQWLAPL